jgi:hypothetical protein
MNTIKVEQKTTNENSFDKTGQKKGRKAVGPTSEHLIP